jgi:2-phospho-L-lactate transferase/gluconeogenesis factor (CofD/UPF0052 family)
MKQVNVVLFSGGRGSQALTRQLVSNPQVKLTLAINGYDDGLSTGEVRRFLGDSLGPSDFRKNASTVARALQSCSPALIELLDLRFPDGYTTRQAQVSLAAMRGTGAAPDAGFDTELDELLANIEPPLRATLNSRLGSFEQALEDSATGFDFSDCSIGNLVFAGCYLAMGRDFNRAIDDYCALLNVPQGVVTNVTAGTDAFLVAIDRDGKLLASEADIVDGSRRNYITEISLVDRPPAEWVDGKSGRELQDALRRHSIDVAANPDLLECLAQADVIVYAPGTQHSSLLPSYMTPGLGRAIAANASAVKVLVTNIQEDAEIPDVNAVEIVDKALYYLRECDQHHIPAPFLITHYLLNDPASAEQGTPYVPLGPLQSIEDPRLVRIANFEDGVTGRHNAQKVLMPFIESFVAREQRPGVAIILQDTRSIDKVSQSLLEAARAGLGELRVTPEFYCQLDTVLDEELQAAMPFPVHVVADGGDALIRAALAHEPDFVMLFESSGMYRGDDIAGLASLLAGGRLDAVWGSRRLSMRDIRESYQLRYQRSRVLGAVSFMGSYLLSLAFLLLYGRYISDSLSGVRAVRADYLRDASVRLDDKRLNYNLLSRILRDQSEIFETPVRFFSLSPDKANRTTPGDGLRCLLEILKWRFRRR